MGCVISNLTRRGLAMAYRRDWGKVCASADIRLHNRSLGRPANHKSDIRVTSLCMTSKCLVNTTPPPHPSTPPFVLVPAKFCQVFGQFCHVDLFIYIFIYSYLDFLTSFQSFTSLSLTTLHSYHTHTYPYSKQKL